MSIIFDPEKNGITSAQDAGAVGLLKKKRELLKNVEDKWNITEPCKSN